MKFIKEKLVFAVTPMIMLVAFVGAGMHSSPFLAEPKVPSRLRKE